QYGVYYLGESFFSEIANHALKLAFVNDLRYAEQPFKIIGYLAVVVVTALSLNFWSIAPM
ncbi:hypothetical protein CU098_006515, partial [Rhizopus stolonifer]